MRYNIHGFSQENAVKLKLDNDCLLILRWFVDFTASGKMNCKFVEGIQYFWVSYEKISDDLPILKFKKDTLYRKLKSMASDETRVLSHITVKQGGTFSYYGFGDNYTSLIHSDENPKGTDINPKGTDENPEGYGQKSVGVRIEIPNKDSSIKDYSISNKKDNVQLDDFINKIWSLYPNNIGKGKISKSVAKKKELFKIGFEHLERAINRYKESSTVKSGFIKNGSTFFGTDYIDYLDENYVKEEAKPVTKNFNNGPDNRVNYDERPFEPGEYDKYTYKVGE